MKVSNGGAGPGCDATEGRRRLPDDRTVGQPFPPATPRDRPRLPNRSPNPAPSRARRVRALELAPLGAASRVAPRATPRELPPESARPEAQRAPDAPSVVSPRSSPVPALFAHLTAGRTPFSVYGRALDRQSDQGVAVPQVVRGAIA